MMDKKVDGFIGEIQTEEILTIFRDISMANPTEVAGYDEESISEYRTILEDKYNN